jgi:hypothetical protein
MFDAFCNFMQACIKEVMRLYPAAMHLHILYTYRVFAITFLLLFAGVHQGGDAAVPCHPCVPT